VLDIVPSSRFSAVAVALARSGLDRASILLAGGGLLGAGRLLRVGRSLVPHQFIVGQSLLVGPCAFLVQSRLGALALGYGVRHPSPMLGFLGRAAASVCCLAVLGHDLFATLLELALTAALGGDPATACKGHKQDGQQDYGHHDDHDDKDG
jgi:hypothetical protein